MIRILKYHEIDFEKYSECLANACQNADYADKKFLDIVSNRQWFVLVYGDYDAIMPVSYIRKFGLAVILMPKICQQLGVFSKKDNSIINKNFYDFLEQNFLVAIYAFNGDNQIDYEVEKKTSYFLKKNDYQSTKKSYSTHRRRNVRVFGNLIGNINFKTDWNEQDKQFFFKYLKGTTKKKENFDNFNIFTQLLNNRIGTLQIMVYMNQIQSLVYLYEGNRNRYLSLFINKYPLINPNFPSITIDQCLQNFIEDKNFDFMGSDLENVAKFNERFGAISYQYVMLSNSKLTLFKKLMNKNRIKTMFKI
jgi:hypothetical protein